MSRKIYFDYGSGWEDATTYIRDDVVITERMCSDTYHYAQNVASFTYTATDVSTFTRFRTASTVKVKIMDGVVQMFQGKIVERPKYSFDGKMNSLQIAIEATDSIKDLDVNFQADAITGEEAAEFVMRNCTIMNSADKTNSLVHQLAYLAGKTDSDIDSSV